MPGLVPGIQVLAWARETSPAMTANAISRFAAFGPVRSDRRAVARAPATAACLLEALGGALGERQLKTAGAAFGRHGAQVLGARIDGEGDAAAAGSLELSRDHGGACLDGVGGGRNVGEQAEQAIRIDAEVSGERERLAEG